MGYQVGCVSEERYTVFKQKMAQIQKFSDYCHQQIISYRQIAEAGIEVKHKGKKSLFDLMSYPNVSRETFDKIDSHIKDIDSKVYEQVEIDAKYSGYLKREYEDIAVFKRDVLRPLSRKPLVKPRA